MILELWVFSGNRKIVDLAGLISPKYFRSFCAEVRLAEFLDAQNVNYLIAFQDMYPLLSEGLVERYSTHGKFSYSVEKI